jgi:hypothetical protein
MIPTGADVLAGARAWLDDDAGSTFTDAVLNRAFRSAYETMITWGLNYQLPRLKNIVTYTLPANTAILTPDTFGIADFGELDLLEERLAGSTDRFMKVWPKDRLSQRQSTTSLSEFVWRGDAMQFVAATTSRELRVTFFQTATAPDLTTVGGKDTSLGWDGSLTFLEKLTAANAGHRKGYDKDADRLRQEARGSDANFNNGLIGGDLWALINHRLVNEQKVQVAPMPYSVMRRRARRNTTFVAAQGGSSAMAPFVFSTSAGNITGTMDGTNPTFYLAFPVNTVSVALNGAALTPNAHYTHAANTLTFIAPYIPQPGADILVEGWQ